MLLRAGLIYCLAVSSLVFGLIAVWQRLEIGAGRDNVTVLSQRVEQLRQELRDEKVKLESAERRALVAEDSLERVTTHQTQTDDDARFKLSGELAAALQERDAARGDALKLAATLEHTQRALREAEAARDAALAAERVARAKSEEVEAAAAAALAVQSQVAGRGLAEAERRADAAPSQGVSKPAAAAIETSALPTAPPPVKPAAVAPVTASKPAVSTAQPKPPAKKAVAKPQPKRSAARPSYKSEKLDVSPF